MRPNQRVLEPMIKVDYQNAFRMHEVIKLGSCKKEKINTKKTQNGLPNIGILVIPTLNLNLSVYIVPCNIIAL